MNIIKQMKCFCAPSDNIKVHILFSCGTLVHVCNQKQKDSPLEAAEYTCASATNPHPVWVSIYDPQGAQTF